MIFALLGGDLRSVLLCKALRKDGHKVRPYALEAALRCCAESAADAAEGAECLLLPLPCERNGRLNAPLSDREEAVEHLLRFAARGTPVLAGMAGERVRVACRNLELPLTDYGLREDFALRNADLTAEGALGLLADGAHALRDSRVLLVGWGRIGRALAEKLLALGAEVTVAARSPEARAAAELRGCRVCRPEEAPRPGYDAVVNTVPARLYGREALSDFGGARLIELASAPYGFDPAAAEELGTTVTLAAGLPGKYAPASAARAVQKTVYSILGL